MGKITVVGAADGKNSEVVVNKKNFDIRWGVRPQEAGYNAFRSRILIAFSDEFTNNPIFASESGFKLFESELFYQLGSPYTDYSGKIGYNFRNSQLKDVFSRFNLDEESERVRMFFWLEWLINSEFLSDKRFLAGKIAESLAASNLGVVLCKQGDKYFFYPSGAELLDIKLILDVLDWLESYPKTREAFDLVLKNRIKMSEEQGEDIAVRQVCELFLQEFFVNGLPLEGQNKALKDFLDKANATGSISEICLFLYNLFSGLDDKTATKQGLTAKETELLLYQCGIFIRYLIQTKTI